ncbi:MAG: gliding motility-associated ABC transporter ATP-binding subunit GldA [Saprospiraceae bacterium]|nr:gliding motility-associated ABC transporter ATP-binding subunit GldA [Saprospiraceae bacterium]
MSIEVTGLTKEYGVQKAVDNISFSAKKGQILGFLGPNGAGKSTTMKMITAYIPPTDGHIEVCGIDVVNDSLASAAKIGYLPENNPLYREMYVKEYLHFIAGLHKLKDSSAKVADMINRTGLQSEQHKKIEQLSKGYRQRVGLAQAMIHDPEVLILDEPTSGLDPNQLVEIRALIKNLGKEKTVVLSTHIMQEVQALCDRVIIINKGKIVADDPIENLQDRISGDIVVNVTFNKKVNEQSLYKISGVRKVRDSANAHSYQISSSQQEDIRLFLFQFAVDQQLVILEMTREQISVEHIFQQLTLNQN